MKKLFNSRFLFILASSLVVLILLIVGSFYLFNDEDDVFVKSGYVLNPLSSTSEKYFFNENVGYKENLSSMIEFKDVDEKVVTVLKDSFIHYMDDSLSFLKNGAILDLDSLKGEKVVSFYNITSESMVEKKDNVYIIESASGDIKLNNFIGRISDNKYIVVGDLSLKMAGNSTTITGDYFEIVYVDEGIVNIENKSVKYQVAAEDSFIYVGNNKIIDLGDKKISVDDIDVMSITAITIDGDENIEIIPKVEEEDGSGQGTGEGTGDGGASGGGAAGGTGNNQIGDGSEQEIGTGGTPGEVTKEVMVTLKDAEVGSTSVYVTFDVLNATAEDRFNLQIVNMATGRTVDIVAQVIPNVEIQVNLLTPNTKYLFMVVNEKDNNKYFQKVFETNSFGIKLEKSYATTDSLAYKVVVEEGTDITNAKLSLYKFNEEKMENEIVKTGYVDATTGETVYVEKITYLSNLGGNIEGEHEVIFDGLDNNTIYTAVLDEFSVASSNFKDIYNITVTSMTLKETPNFSNMTVTKDVGSGSFDLSLGNITDPDNAIVSYTYLIYNKLDDTLAIEPIVKTNASPLTVSIGDKENQLKNDTNYYYKAIIEYYDNEKYIEYVTSDSIIFMMGNDPYITVVPNESLIDYDQIGATIYLTDNSCLVSMPGREKCSGTSNVVVEVSKVNAVTGERTSVYSRLVDFTVDGDEIKYDLFVPKLQPGTTYSIDVKAQLNNSVSPEKKEILHTDTSSRLIVTKSLASFNVQWTDYNGTEGRPLITAAQFIANDDDSEISPEESVASISKIIIKLYDGKNVVDLSSQVPIFTKNFSNTESFNIKELFYDNLFQITNDGTFGLTMETLINLSLGEVLNEYYTVSIDAYTANNDKINLTNNAHSYKVSPAFFMDAETVLDVTALTNQKAGGIFEGLNNSGTVVGYNLAAYFDRATLISGGMTPTKVNYYVYDMNKQQIPFYIKNDDGVLELVNELSVDISDSEVNFSEVEIYMGYGTSYETIDEVMSRGNPYYVGFHLVTKGADGKTSLYPLSTGKSPATYGLYETVSDLKESPKLQMYISSSDADSITYYYRISDPDNAVYKEFESENYGLYATVNNGSEMKLDMTKVSEDSSFNVFEGNVTIDGLFNGRTYSIYYKHNALKTGVLENDVLPYLDGNGAQVRIFDGYYNVSEYIELYNFKYKIINNPLEDNKVVIKMLATDEILDRILSYKLTFTSKDSYGEEIVLNKELWQLTTCDGSSENEKPRCLSIDYMELQEAGMKSDINNTKTISVNVTALYDNGLTGYDFKVGSSNDADYRYCIMQDNSSAEGLGSYIVLSSTGQNFTIWSDTLGSPKGYYTYSLNTKNYKLDYSSHLTGHSKNMTVSLTGLGYYSSKYGTLNPKMISIDEMECSGSSDSCNTFSFSSITPKVSVKTRAALINGSTIGLTLSGIDINDLKKEEDGNYYLYIETWEDLSHVGNLGKNFVARPTVKVKINSSNPTETIVAVIDGLKEQGAPDAGVTGIYYFNVYAYMYKNGNAVYTQLFDAGTTDGYVTKTYSFKSLKASELFYNISVGFSSSDEIYGNRSLNTRINLVAYKYKTDYNFDLIYVMCEVGDATCGPNEDDTNIFRKVIPLSKLSTSIDDSVDISNYNLEYDKNYLMYVYTSSDYYDSDNENVLTKRTVLINQYKSGVSLRKLSEPSFVVTRSALLDKDQYVLDFSIVVNDIDRTLVNGNYYIKLVDSKGDIVGNMKLVDSDGNYYDVSNYSEYAFDAFVVNKKVRITGLKPSEKYTFIVYGDAYMNNYDSNESSEGCSSGQILDQNRNCVDKYDENGINPRKIQEISRSYTVYTTNDYGVAFGTVTYGVTEKSIVATFLGGSNFNNVKEVIYTVGLWDDELNSSTVAGSFVIGENNKAFELSTTSDDWRFVIDPTGMKNVLNKTYKVNMSFIVYDPATGEDIILTSEDVPSFEGTVTYYEED